MATALQRRFISAVLSALFRQPTIQSIGSFNWQALLTGLVALAVLILWPRVSKRIPASLAMLFMLQRLGPANAHTQSLMTGTLGLALATLIGGTIVLVFVRGQGSKGVVLPGL